VCDLLDVVMITNNNSNCDSDFDFDSALFSFVFPMILLLFIIWNIIVLYIVLFIVSICKYALYCCIDPYGSCNRVGSTNKTNKEQDNHLI